MTRAETPTTDGYLPLAAFRHLEPTAIGVIDLDSPPEFKRSLGVDGARPHRDALALVRLHGTPLGVVHLEGPQPLRSRERLAAAIWSQLGPTVVEHVTSHGCASVPNDADALLAGLPSAGTGMTADPPGSVAVIIPTTGRLDVLERCLHSLLGIDRSDLDVIIVDNRPATGETLALVSRIAASDRRVRYVAEPRKGGSVARNRGLAEAANADYVAFTDDDVVVDPHWLHYLLSPFSDGAVTAVTGMVLPLELETPAQKQFEQYGGFSKGMRCRSYDLHSGRADDRLLYPYWGGVFGSGNSMAFRRTALVAAGGFDPALGPGSPTGAGEDIAAFSDTILRGGRLVYEPRSLCWHEHRRDDQALRDQLFHYGTGFTASLCKAASQDPRFLRAAARTVPVAIELLCRRALAEADERQARLPRELARLEYSGMLRGPLLYGKSVRRARRLRLNEPAGPGWPMRSRRGRALGGRLRGSR